jgi:hypothetical protein
MVCCFCIFETEWHANVTVRSERCDERGHELVGLLHCDLMVAGIRIKEAEDFTPRGRVDYLIYAW